MSTKNYKFKPRDNATETISDACKRNITAAIEYLKENNTDISFIIIRPLSSCYSNLFQKTQSWRIVFKKDYTFLDLSNNSDTWRRYSNLFYDFKSDLSCFKRLNEEIYCNQSVNIDDVVDAIVKTDSNWIDLGYTNGTVNDYYCYKPWSYFRVLVNIKKTLNHSNLFNFPIKNTTTFLNKSNKINFNNFLVNSENPTFSDINAIEFQNIPGTFFPISSVERYISSLDTIINDKFSSNVEQTKAIKLKKYYSEKLKNNIYNNESLKTIFYKYITDEIFQAEKQKNKTKKSLITVKENCNKATEKTKEISDEIHLLLEISDELN